MAIARDVTGPAVKMTVAATSQTVDITTAATGSFVFCLVALGLNQASLTFTGWTQLLAADESTATHYGLFWRQKIAGDTTFTVSWPSSTKGTIGWVSYTGLDPVTPQELAAVTLHTTGTSFASPSLTPTTAAEWALFCCYARDTTLATDLPDGTAWTPDAALTELLDASNQASTGTWVAIEFADSGAAVTQAAHSYTATSATAESHGAAFLLFLIAASGAAPAVTSPQYAPAWHPGLPGFPGGTPFTPWPQYMPGAVAGQDFLDAAATITAAGAASLDVAKAGWQLPPAYAPAWFPSAPSAPGAQPFTAWPVWLGATPKSDPLSAAGTVAATGAAALTESKPVNAASSVTASAAAAETTSKPLNAAQTATATAAAALDVVKAGNVPAPAYAPAWFPSAPGVPGGEPFAPWPVWSGFGGTPTPQDLLNAAATVTATGAAALAESKPLTAATTVTAARAAALTEAKPLSAAQTATASRAAAQTAAKPVTAAATATATLAASLTTVASAQVIVPPGPLYVPGWFPGAPAVPATAAFMPWPVWTAAPAPLVVAPFTVGALTATDAPASVLAPAVTGSVLTASTAPSGALTAAVSAAGSGAEYGSTYSGTYGPAEGTLTATDQRTGGPT